MLVGLVLLVSSLIYISVAIFYGMMAEAILDKIFCYLNATSIFAFFLAVTWPVSIIPFLFFLLGIKARNILNG